MKITAMTAMASLQDMGRFGHRRFGIGTSGAMDSWAIKAGNALLNNPDNTVAIEVTLGGMTLAFDDSDVDATTGEISVCLTGALYEAYVTDTAKQTRERVPNGWRIAIKAGQTLELVRAIQGMHGYICIQGGLAVEQVLGSASTNAKAEFGGYHGRLLKVGDVLSVTNTQRPKLSQIGMAQFEDDYHDLYKNAKPIIRIVKNSETDYFTRDSLLQLTKQPYKLLSSSNRMGYRLEGEQTLALTEPLQMNSHGVDMGMIQVPPQGHPIVLMADAQTTGGYPKIASIIQADIGKFAQLRFGQSCQFQWVTLDEVISGKKARERHIQRVKNFAQGK